MTGSSPGTPPLAALLIGLSLRPLPKRPLQALLAFAARLMARRHPTVFERLRIMGPATIVIDATDLPYVFEFRPNTAGDHLRLVERGATGTATAAIRGPLAVLVSLLQGKCDGDALFFSRTLVIEGDTACVVALRNAIDNAEVDLLADVASIFGPARGPVEYLMRDLDRRTRRLLRQRA